jgi:hypothetical protein
VLYIIYINTLYTVGVGIVIKASMWRMTLGARYPESKRRGKSDQSAFTYNFNSVVHVFDWGKRLLRDFTSEFIFFIIPTPGKFSR